MCVYCGWTNVHFVSFVRKCFSTYSYANASTSLYQLKFAQIGFLGEIKLQFEFNCECKQKCETIIYSNVCYLVC